MKFRLLAAVAAAVLLLVLMLINAPARLLTLALPDDGVALQGLNGTLWQGSAARAVVDTPAGALHLGAVEWRLRPLSLLSFAPSMDIQSRWGRQELTGRVTLRGPRDLDLRDVEATVSADLLRQFLPVEVDGTFSAQLASLSLRSGMPVAGEGRLVWRDASWSSPEGAQPLGSYGLDFSQPEGEALTGQVITLEGPVQAEGRVSLEGATYELDLRIGGGGRLNSQISNALSLLAEPQPDGSFQLQLDGEIQG